MKNKLIGALAIVGVVGTLVACGGEGNPSTPSTPSTRNLTIGVGTTVVAPAYDHYGRLLVEVNFATALYEGDKVAASLVDVYQIQLDSEKAALKNETVVTKRDLHDDYAMKDTSANIGNIEGGAEWWEQAAALETYTEGKSTFDETSTDLTAGCTMAAGDLLNVVAEAKTNTKGNVAVANGNYTIALGHNFSVEADETSGALKQINIAFAGLLLDGDAKVVTAYIDEVQIPLTFNAEAAEGECEYTITPTNAYGSPTTQYNYKGQTIASKKELGDDYAMKGTSANIGNIEGGAEWFEQAAAFEDYLVGKTVSEINLEDSSLLAGCTMYAGAYEAACDNAVDSTLYNSKAITL